MPIGAVWRDLLEAQAAERATLKQGAVNYVTAEAFLMTMAAKGFATLLADDTVVSPQEGAWAAREWHKMTTADSATEQMAWILARQNRIVEVWRQLPEHYQQQLLTALSDEQPPQLVIEGNVDDEVAQDTEFVGRTNGPDPFDDDDEDDDWDDDHDR